MAKFSLVLVLGPPWVFQRLHETLNHLAREQVFLLTSYPYEALQTLQQVQLKVSLRIAISQDSLLQESQIQVHNFV